MKMKTRPKNYDKEKKRKNMQMKNVLRIAPDDSQKLVKGQKVFVCKTSSQEIISQRTGKKMGMREIVISQGVIGSMGEELVVQTVQPIEYSGAVGVGRTKAKHDSRFRIRNKTQVTNDSMYIKVIEE